MDLASLTWEILDDVDVDDLVARSHWTEEHPPAREPVRCLCGRFAKYGGDQHYYNGTYDCYRYFVNCTHCGEVVVECV
jgi:hypothetical protein